MRCDDGYSGLSTVLAPRFSCCKKVLSRGHFTKGDLTGQTQTFLKRSVQQKKKNKTGPRVPELVVTSCNPELGPRVRELVVTSCNPLLGPGLESLVVTLALAPGFES